MKLDMSGLDRLIREVAAGAPMAHRGARGLDDDD